MDKGSGTRGDDYSPKQADRANHGLMEAPSISLPKGGGAIKGMGEKFSANPVTGTGSMSVPIAISPGRSGFGPQLSLSYDSGAGNGPFGLGWHLSLPSIARKTDKGLPKYQDDDVFILSGAEDLVPEFEKDANDNWVFKDGSQVVHEKPRTIGGVTYLVRRYRPRIEGLFARFEFWANQTDPSDCFWRSISRDNITTWYGKTTESRIADAPEPNGVDPPRIFSWLIYQSHDDKGNVINYDYKSENSEFVDLSHAYESNRTDLIRSSNRYLKRIRYGNHKPYRPTLSAANPWPAPPSSEDTNGSKNWLFEVVFDYGEHDTANPLPVDANKKWPVRNDPFSTYRAGFEVRTYRLCQRILMFHHFPDEPGVEANCLVRSSDFNYSSTDDFKNAKNAAYTLLASASHTSYQRKDGGGYLSRSFPPLEFKYTQAIIDEIVQEVDPESVENLPYGLDGSNYQWVDLDGEGLSGILTEQADGWFYKRNLSANHLVKDPTTQIERTVARFSPVELVARKPNAMLAGGQSQFMDLAGDGQTDLVEMEGPVRGFYERTVDQNWENFKAFSSWPNVDTRDPNLKFIDLTGDGHADILISEDQAFIWHASLAEAGYSVAQRVQQKFDEEKGPRLVFADSEQSIFLADLSGDGLTDLVRIRNGEVCYWPNLGYCRFGAKVTMDSSPWFDSCDQFNPRQVRLVDIDGSGTTDILYLHGKAVHIYFNQSGNSWSLRRELPYFPAIDNLAAIQVMDLLGNGTACLVWSSPLPNDTRCPMRYIDLMGGQKPHLLISMKNNLGAETTVRYAPSTQFYLRDKDAGKPWITKLPFPVHVVEKVSVTDQWRKSRFSSTYSYHHGYFDGVEREFRGFGRVEQVDVESYGEFSQGNAASPYITDDKMLYQPPVKTVTWYHTGAFLDRERILSQFEHEYFPNWFEDLNPDKKNVLGSFAENTLPAPDLDAQDLSTDEWCEALRACKGMVLRQEVYELDVDALERPKNPQHVPVKLFSTKCHNCHIHRLQPQERNLHAVFLVVESEAITYHYELDLTQADVRPDPRIAHTLNLNYDELGNVLQTAAITYRRLGKFVDDSLKPNQLKLIHSVQQETHLAYTEMRYTKDSLALLDNYRLRLPCEIRTYELTGIGPQDANDVTSIEKRYFTIDEVRRFQLSTVHQNSGEAVLTLAYHQLPDNITPQKRLVEHARTLFFSENLVDPRPLGDHGPLGLPYENYKLALTDSLLDAVFEVEAGNNKLDLTIDGAVTAHDRLIDAAISGYLSGVDLTNRFAPTPAAELVGQYWIRSGIAGYAPDAAQKFYLPERYTDAFGNVTTVNYDGKYDLFIQSSADALSNTSRVKQFDYRLLAPREMQDINNNMSEVFFDVLGLPIAMAVKGKGNEGDNLAGFDSAPANASRTQPDRAALRTFFDAADLDETQAHVWLANATARHLYDFGEIEQMQLDGTTVVRWENHPSCACSIVREQHVSQLTPGAKSPIQAAFEYSDGMGSVIVKKIQAEPEAAGQPLRWVASGKTILNNKGKPVKQYEPYFSASAVGHRFEEPAEVDARPLINYYDAAGRTLRTGMPDGSYSRVEFSPWYVRSHDQNDTVKEPGNTWFARKTAIIATSEEKRAAQLAAEHSDTPALTILDSLGREVISIAHNRVRDAAGVLKDDKYLSYTKLDTEGKPLWIRDARGNLVMQYIFPQKISMWSAEPNETIPAKSVPCYDIAGNLLYQHSMDAGDRWMLNDAAGKPMLAWDSRGHMFRSDYDTLHRPAGSFVKGADPLDANRIIQFEKVIYGDTPGNGLVDVMKLNLRGKPYQHHDTAGVVISMGRNPATGDDEAFDYKGNLLRSTRQLVSDYKNTPDWSLNPALESEIFTSSSRFDALNRPIQLVAPHSDQPTTKLNVIRPGYNPANLLERVDVWLKQTAEPTALLSPATANLNAVTNIDYDAKGQRLRIDYNEASHRIVTNYTYDKDTFRLTNLLSTRPEHSEIDKRTLQDLSYTYDPVGNITAIRDAAQQTVFFNNIAIEPNNAYTYDALYRLIHAEGREHAVQNNTQRDAKNFEAIIGMPFPNSPEALQRYSEDYKYDPVGNIMGLFHTGGAIQRWVRRYQYALDSNRLLATRLPSDPAKLPDYTKTPGYSSRYGYDTHGNMTSMLHLPVMDWDFKDQLCASQRQVDNNVVGEKTYYVYDAGGQRVRKVTETQFGKPKDERIYLGGFEVYRKYNDNGQTVSLERETLHVMDDKQRVALIETRTRLIGDDPALPKLVRFQLGNHLGSASLELNDKAQVISYEEFHPYGTTAYEAARIKTETAKRYRYTGKERDEESGLYYHVARYFAAWLGRWTSCDPAGHADGPNLYIYANNDPVRLFDSNGRSGVLASTLLNHVREQINSSSAIGSDAQLQESIKNLGDSEFEPIFNEVSGSVDEPSRQFLSHEYAARQDKKETEELQRRADYAALQARERELSKIQREYRDLSGAINKGVVSVVPIVGGQSQGILSLSGGKLTINTVGTQGKEVPLEKDMANVLNTLATKAIVRQATSGSRGADIALNSLLRGGDAGLHGTGRAVDIFRYGTLSLEGTWNDQSKERYVQAAITLIRDLPTGHYGLGLPIPRPDDPDVSSLEQRAIVKGTADDLAIDSRIKGAIAEAKMRNVVIDQFLDQYGHIHLSIARPGDRRR